MRAPSVHESRAGTNAVLTNLALGYKPQEAGYIGLKIAPPVAVDEYGGRILQFDDANFEEVDDSRADGGEYREISRGYEGLPFTVDFHGLRYRVPEKRFEQSLKRGVNWADLAVKDLASRSALAVEKQIANLVLNPDNYPANNKEIITAGSYWGGAGTDSIDPYEVILETRRHIVTQIGCDPNTLVLGREVFDKMVTNQAILEHYKHTNSDSITQQILARRFGVDQIIVGSSISKQTKNSEKGFIWGNFALLCYVNRNTLNGSLGLNAASGISREEPSCFYTYTYRDHPTISNRWYHEETSSWNWKIDFDRTPVACMTQGAFLFINPVL
ncbi:MAG TPA: major capsid protein [Vampirovibrionales bacterium]